MIFRASLIRFHSIAAATVSFSLLLLGGCGRPNSGGGTGGSAAAPEINEAGFVKYPAGDYVQQTPGRPGGTLRISTQTDTAILDPHGVSSVYIQWFGRFVFDNLT